MRGEVGDVDVPREGPFHLGAQFAEHLGVVGVLPQVLERAREPALTGLQRRGMGDRTPPVAVVFGVEREVDADVVVGGRLDGGMARPRCGHRERGRQPCCLRRMFSRTNCFRLGFHVVISVGQSTKEVLSSSRLVRNNRWMMRK